MATKRIAIIAATKDSAKRLLSSYDYYHIQAVWNQKSSTKENISLFADSGFSAIINEFGDCLDAELLCWLGVCFEYEDASLILQKLLDKYLQTYKSKNYYVVVANVHE